MVAGRSAGAAVVGVDAELGEKDRVAPTGAGAAGAAAELAGVVETLVVASK